MPQEVQSLLIRALREVVVGEKGTARGVKEEFPRSIVGSVIGKTSTAEIMELVSLDPLLGLAKVKHVGFGAIAYDGKKPELVVVALVRYADWGRYAALLP